MKKKTWMAMAMAGVMAVSGLGLAGCGADKDKGTAVVEMDLNPSAQFVVNKDNKVVSVNYLNRDADVIYSDIDVVGMNINDVARAFTDVAIQTQYKGAIDINADASAKEGTNRITISIVGGSDDQNKLLQSSLEATVDGKFDEYGIYGYASVSVGVDATNLVEKYQTSIKNLSMEAKDFADKTEAEVLEMIRTQSQKLEGISSEALNGIAKKLDATLLSAIQTAKEELQKAKNKVAEMKKNISDLNAQLEITKDDTTIASIKLQIKVSTEALDKLEKALDEAQKYLDKLETELDGAVQKLVDEAKKQYAKYKEDVKAKLKKMKEEAKAEIDAKIKKLNDMTAEDRAKLVEAIKSWRITIRTEVNTGSGN